MSVSSRSRLHATLTALGVLGSTLAVAATAVGCSSCKNPWPGPSRSDAHSSTHAAPTPSVTGSIDPGPPPVSPHPRFLLTPDRLKAIAALKAANAPSWTRLVDECEDFIKEAHPSGYLGWDWANGALNLSLCYRMTNKKAYADWAVKYFIALLDDKEKVGDHLGGDKSVRRDDGYPIRSHGALGAIAYDWLDGTPGMTPELKKRAVDRFVAWTTWFKDKGFSHDEPISNYYVSYFAAVSFAALAAAGEDPRADDLRKRSAVMWNKEVVPAYAKLAGGDFPEGWQYGDNVLAFLAIFCDAERTSHGNGANAARVELQLPWIRESVDYHAHSLSPNGKSMFDTGDWQEKPPKTPAHGMLATALLLPRDDVASKRAAFLGDLANKALGENGEEWKWFGVLTDDPQRPVEDTRKGPTSYLATGTGTMMARTDWSAGAVWTGMTSAPSLSDHQHLDAAHFEIVRGADYLVIDSGDYAAYSSMSHNTILVDDKREMMSYTPNQGTWSDTAKVGRFADDGRVVYAMADYASAYDGIGSKDRNKHAVSRAERELVFVRGTSNGSARLVVYDRMTVAKPAYQTTFLLHGGGAPPQLTTTPKGGAATIRVGQSSAWATMLLPLGASPRVVNEPTPPAQDRPFYNNEPPEGVKATRIEVASPRADATNERRFLTTFVIGASTDAAPASATLVQGEGVEGAMLSDEAFVFVAAGPQKTAAPVSFKIPAASARFFVVGLAIDARYEVTASKAGDTCAVSISPGASAAARAASHAGTLALTLTDCALAK
jgi:hypothetical protein